MPGLMWPGSNLERWSCNSFNRSGGGRVRIKDSKFRYVEAMLYEYPDMINEIERIREEILCPGGSEDMVRVQSSGKSDPTASRATALTAHDRLRHLQNTVEAIERALRKLDPEKKKLVELKYWQRLPNRQVATKLHVSEMSFYRWRDQIIAVVACNMGILKVIKKC